MTKEPIDVVSEYQELFAAGDESCISLVADDASFDGPAAQADGKQEIAELNAGLLPAIQGAEVLHRSAAGNTVASLLRYELAGPDGQDFSLEMTEIDTVRDGRIETMTAYYDPREFLEVFGGAE